jgi:hypothetical protein
MRAVNTVKIQLLCLKGEYCAAGIDDNCAMDQGSIPDRQEIFSYMNVKINVSLKLIIA